MVSPLAQRRGQIRRRRRWSGGPVRHRRPDAARCPSCRRASTRMRKTGRRETGFARSPCHRSWSVATRSPRRLRASRLTDRGAAAPVTRRQRPRPARPADRRRPRARAAGARRRARYCRVTGRERVLDREPHVAEVAHAPLQVLLEQSLEQTPDTGRGRRRQRAPVGLGSEDGDDEVRAPCRR